MSQTTRSKAEQDYLTERLHAANWLVKSLNQRAATILKVGAEIVRQQNAFIRHGVSSPRPLITRDIANAIGMHERIISAVSNKCIATPRGVYELKYFFTPAMPASCGNGTHSADHIRHRQSDTTDYIDETKIIAAILCARMILPEDTAADPIGTTVDLYERILAELRARRSRGSTTA